MMTCLAAVETGNTRDAITGRVSAVKQTPLGLSLVSYVPFRCSPKHHHQVPLGVYS